MEIVTRKLSEIKPYENNPRNNDEAVEYVANSIKEFGFKNPIILDSNGVIIAGHTRYKAAKELGLEEVPCIYADDLTEEQVKAFRLADNKTAELAYWDFDLLDGELEDIFDIDMGEFGFLEGNNKYFDGMFDGCMSGEQIQPDEFTVSFTISREYEDVIKKYITEQGKEIIVNWIIKEAECYA